MEGKVPVIISWRKSGNQVYMILQPFEGMEKNIYELKGSGFHGISFYQT